MSETSNWVREMFGRGDDERDAGLTTPDDIVRFDSLCYGADAKEQILDVYKPRRAENETLPVIVSVHGGGWVYGDKERYQYYCMNLAQHGFAVVNFTYRLAPEHKFPASLEDINFVLQWVEKHADTYGLDLANLFAVGDSAGAHMLGLYIGAMKSESYARTLGLSTPVRIEFRAVALNCGAYEIAFTETDGEPELTERLMRDYLPQGGNETELQLVNVLERITSDFPPVYLMTATEDFLADQAPKLMEKLMACKVPFIFQIFGSAENPLGHVFHLNIRSNDAKECNDAECAFFTRHCK